jgi:large subunit ribosomal protein L5
MATTTATETPRLLERYRQEIVPALMEEFGYGNVMRVPRLVKVMVNMGVGDARDDVALLEAAAGDLALLSGQKAKLTRARKSVSNFKIREGMAIGCCVTLRRARMYEFVDRLVSIALPRIRDFRGLPPHSFDGHGNYSLGLREQTVFPELDPDKVRRMQGMHVTLVTSAPTDREAASLLRKLGLPLRDE